MDEGNDCDISSGELISRVHLPRELMDELVVGYLAEYREQMSGNTGYLGGLNHVLPRTMNGLRVVWCEDGVTFERRRILISRFGGSGVSTQVQLNESANSTFQPIGQANAVCQVD